MDRDQGSAAHTAEATELTDEFLSWLGLSPEPADRKVETPEDSTPAAASYVVIRSRESSPPPKDASAPAGSAPRAWRSRRVRSAVVLVAAAAVVFGVYSMGKPTVPALSRTTDQASAESTSAPVDRARLGELMKQISANPKDIAALQALGDLYFQAGDYRTAGGWEQKILAIDPKNVTALLAFGAAQFNLGNGADAERSWLQVTALDPRKAEAHYDLGFLYLSQNPPDMAKVRKEWDAVVAIDPNSEIAKTVAAHLKRLESPSPGASPAAPGK